MLRTTYRALAIAASLALLAPLAAFAQSAPAGVVTALQGQATIIRTAAVEPAPLRFRDDVFLHDRIRTGDHSLVRLLLGGRAAVTVRERTWLTITEHPGASLIHVGAGRASISAVKSRMRPGERIDIVTPNAVATIRGTVVVAEVAGGTSTITVLKGLVDVKPVDPTSRQPVGVVYQLGPLQQIIVPDGGRPSERRLSPEAGQRLASEFRTAPREAPAAVNTRVTEGQLRAAVEHLNQLAASVSSRADGTPGTAGHGVGSVDAHTAPATNALTSTTTTLTGGSAAGSTLTSTVSTLTAPVTSLASPTASLTSSVTSVASPVPSALTSTVSTLTSPATTLASPVTQTVQSLPQTLNQLTTTTSTTLTQPLSTTTQNLLTPVTSTTQNLLGTTTNLLGGK